MWFEVVRHRQAGLRRRAGGAMLAMGLVCSTLAAPVSVQASAAGAEHLPAAAAVMTASSGLAPELGLAMRIDAASKAGTDERTHAADGGSASSLFLGSIGGAVALGLLLLAGVNSRKRWPAVGSSKEA